MGNNAKSVTRRYRRRDERRENGIKIRQDGGRREGGGEAWSGDFSRDFSDAGSQAIKNARKTTLRYKPRETLLILSFPLSLSLHSAGRFLSPLVSAIIINGEKRLLRCR